jgi:hypothetical protein
MPNPKALRYPQNYDRKRKFLPPVMRAEAAVLCPEWIDKEAARGAERLPRGQSRSRLPAMKAMRPPNSINNAAEKPISPPPIAAETGVKLALRSPCILPHRGGSSSGRQVSNKTPLDTLSQTGRFDTGRMRADPRHGAPRSADVRVS